MATDTRRRGGGVIKAAHKPVGGGVTSLTGFRGGDVGDALAGGNNPIVTGFASSQYLGVIDQWYRRGPGNTGMAGLAYIGGVDVRGALAGGGSAVVTGDTGIRGGSMIKCGHQPGRHQMTHLARFHRGHVGRPLAGGNHAIVTTFASTQHLIVIHYRHRQPTHGGMAGVTLIAGIDVCGAFAGGNHPVVTTLTGTQRFIVINQRGRHPRRNRVASRADIAGQNMRGGFIAGDHTVVTGLAHTHGGDLTVIHRTGGHPRRIHMAGLTQIGSTDMGR